MDQRSEAAMQRLLRMVGVVVLFALPAKAGEPIQFSADMAISQSTGQVMVEKLYVGNAQARIDRVSAGNDRVSSLLMDFKNQTLYLLLPRDKMYLQIQGSAGIYFYRGSFLFRPQTPDTACSDWIPEADMRGITLRCARAGEERIDGRSAQKWEATATNGAHGTLWYDPSVNFLVKLMRVSKDGVQTGYELKNVQIGAQSPKIFNLPVDYHQFTFNMLLDLLTDLGQWQ
jgi:hypothetical protein